MGSFAEGLRTMPEISQFFVLGGSDDFLLHITARDTDHIRQFVLENLSTNPAVAGTQTSLVFEHSRGTPGLGLATATTVRSDGASRTTTR